jgi:hypothetical protein
MVSHFPSQDFDDALFYDSESEEIEETLDVLGPSCYDKGNDVIYNIDKFIHVGRRKWDVIGRNGDPIYDIEGHFQLFPLPQPYVIATNLGVWQHEDVMVTNLFQPPMDNLLQYSHDDFRSRPKEFDAYSFEHLDLFYEENFQPSLCSNFDKGEDMVSLEKDFCDKNFQPTLLSSCHSASNMIGGSFHDGHPLVIQSFFQPLAGCRPFQFHTKNQQAFVWELKIFSRPSFIPYLAPSFPIDNRRTSHRFLLIPSS